MTIAAKHFDPQLGIDIHMYAVPPWPLPTPHIGMVLDPFDYLPLIGSTIKVGGAHRATAGTGGLDIHIPLGVWGPPLAAPMGPQFDGEEIFMGSRTVSADGEPFSRIAMPVLDCNLAGLIPPFRIKKLKKPLRNLWLPTGINVAIPARVQVGGPPTVSWTALAFHAAFAGLGVLRRSRLGARAGEAFRKVRQRVFRNMDSGFLKCKVLRAEPVDIRDGSVSVEHEDFAIPGRLPLAWTRGYRSHRGDEAGACGHGWRTPADIRLEIAADGVVLFDDGYGAALFPCLPDVDGVPVLELVDGARLSRDGADLLVRARSGLRYRFAYAPRPGIAVLPGERVLPIERIEDACGNHWRFERRDGHLVRIVESGVDGLQGRFIEVESRQGRIDRLQLHDPATGLSHLLASYRYADGDLVAALDPLEAARTFEYRRHRMVRHTDRVGLSFHYAYDAQWRVVHAWGDGGLYDYRFGYDELLRETEVTDSLGHVSIVKFDENGLPLCEIDPLDGVTTFEYDEVGRTVAVTDPEGLRTGFAYDARGNLLELVRPDGSTLRQAYDDEDRLIEAVDPDGHAWRQAYDERGLLASQADPLQATTRYGYDANGLLVEQANARGAITRLRYDRYGLLAVLVDALGHESRFEHDALGRLQRQVDPLGQATAYDYDAKGRLLRIRAPDGGEVTCDYDAEDQLVRYVDEAGAQTRLQYVGIGQVGKRVQADGHAVEYRYDTEERLVAVTNQRGENYRLVRDALGRIVEEIDYWGQARRHAYDAAGRLTATVDPLGQRIAFATDKLGRITRKTLPDVRQPGQQVQESFVYDKRGLLIECRNPARTVKRSYDAAGKLLDEMQDGFRVGYGYDEAGNRILRETSAGNRIAYGYDLRGQVVEVGINDEAPIAIERDALGRATCEQLGAHVQRQFQYDGRSLLTAQTVLKDAAPLFETAYDYDRAGNLTRRRDSEQGIDEYRYDVIGRLLEHVDPKGRIEKFFNDAAGDRLRTAVREVQARKVVGGEDGATSEWTREGIYEGVQYVFDRAGDLVRKGSPSGPAPDDLELVWDANHRLAESRRSGEATHYGYDPLGRRVFKRNPTHTTWFFWDGDALLGEVKQANDDPDVAPVWVGNVANLVEVKKRRQKLARLHERAREYVYYPSSFVPLALIDPTIAIGEPVSDAPASHDDVSEPSRAPARQTVLSRAMKPAVMAPPSMPTNMVDGSSVLGSIKLGVLHAKATNQEPESTELRLGGAGVRLGGASGKQGATEPDPRDIADPKFDSVTLQHETKKAELLAVPISMEERRVALLDETRLVSVSKPVLAISHVFYYHVDPSGCPTRITNGMGQVLWSASYAVWGNISESHIEIISNPIRFQGQYFDHEIGLIYNRYRYMDPILGAYICQDPLGLAPSENLYGYADNPFSYCDPLGLQRISGETAGGMSRATPEWRMRYGPASMREHHLIPQAMMKNEAFMAQLRATGIKDPEGYIHRQISIIPHGTHAALHDNGWNKQWKDWFASNPSFSRRDLQSQIRTMMREHNVPRSSRNFARRYGCRK
ncbi:MAG TPA: type IV secretion protein Rhs [Xanthomonadaceae bacterium]|nr:type IV secretion protein Rhs [Xanthomonadaceae bacterium]